MTFKDGRLPSSGLKIAGVLALCAVASSAQAGTIYDEGIQGDLPTTGDSALEVHLAPGQNNLFGRSGKESSTAPAERDYFWFNVPNGYRVDSIQVIQDKTSPVAAGQGLEFIGMQAGNSFTVPPGFSADGLIGYAHFKADSGEILDDLSLLRSGGTGTTTGYSGPLGPGDFAFWVQDTGVGEATYGLSFHLSPVPDAGPGLVSVVGAMGAIVAASRRRFRPTGPS